MLLIPIVTWTQRDATGDVDHVASGPEDQTSDQLSATRVNAHE